MSDKDKLIIINYITSVKMKSIIDRLLNKLDCLQQSNEEARNREMNDICESFEECVIFMQIFCEDIEALIDVEQKALDIL